MVGGPSSSSDELHKAAALRKEMKCSRPQSALFRHPDNIASLRSKFASRHVMKFLCKLLLQFITQIRPPPPPVVIGRNKQGPPGKGIHVNISLLSQSLRSSVVCEKVGTRN